MLPPYLYPESQLVLLLRLIREANPNIPIQMTPSNIRVYSGPVAQAVPSGGIADTNLVIAPVIGTGAFTGSVQVQYRRINLSNLFRSQSAYVNLYVTEPGNITREQVVTELNKNYGLALIPSDLENKTVAPGASSFAIASTSLCYSGSIPIFWVRGKRPLDTILTDTQPLLATREYLRGNNLTVDPRPRGEFFLYGADFTPIRDTILQLGSDFTFYVNTPERQTLVNFMNQQAPGYNFRAGDYSVTGQLSQTKFYQTALPYSGFPYANSDKYNHICWLTSPSGAVWFSGNILMHFNV